MSFFRRARNRLAPLPKPFRLDPPSPNGFERVYHVHIRKCGGTSVNRMALAALSGALDADWAALHRHWRHRIMVAGRPVVGWRKDLIERGAFFYGFSHVPFHALSLPLRTYTIAVLRDPVARVLSHYRMLLGLRQSCSDHLDVHDEGHWLGDGFSDFLDRIPREDLCRQLYTFSERFDMAEAVENARRITNLRWLGDMPALAVDLSREFGLQFAVRRDNYHETAAAFEPSRPDRAKLTDSLADEFRFLDRISRKTAPETF